MHNAQILVCQHQRLLGQPSIERGLVGLGQHLPRRVLAAVFFGAAGKIPAGAVFGFVHQGIQFVIAEHHKGMAGIVCLLKPSQHCGAVGAAVAQIAHKHELAPLRVAAVVAVAQMVQQRLQSGKFAVHIADDVERGGGQGLAVAVSHGGLLK